MDITLFESITMFCGTDIILGNNLRYFPRFECGKHPGTLCGILLVLHNIVMDLNDVMDGFISLDPL